MSSIYRTMQFLEDSLIELIGDREVNKLVDFVVDNNLSDKTYYKILTYLRDKQLRGKSKQNVLLSIDTIKANILNGTFSVEYYNPIEDNK